MSREKVVINTEWNYSREIVPYISDADAMVKIIPLRYYTVKAEQIAILTWPKNSNYVKCSLLVSDDEAKVNAGRLESKIIKLPEPENENSYSIIDLLNNRIIYSSFNEELLNECKWKYFSSLRPEKDITTAFVLGSDDNFYRMYTRNTMVTKAFLLKQVKGFLKSDNGNKRITDFGLKLFTYLMCSRFGYEVPNWNAVSDLREHLIPMAHSQIKPKQIESLENIWVWGGEAIQQKEDDNDTIRTYQENWESSSTGDSASRFLPLIPPGVDDIGDVNDIIRTGHIPHTETSVPITGYSSMYGVTNMEILGGILYVYHNPEIIESTLIYEILDLPLDKVICVTK